MICNPPPPIEKFAVCTPTVTFAFWMNWRSEPCTVRSMLASSSPSRRLVMALKLKPKSTLATPAAAPVLVTIVTCSEPTGFTWVAASDTRASRPPNSAPFAAVKPVPSADPTLP